MKPERIQFAPKLPAAPPPPPASTGTTGDRGVYQTFQFASFRNAESFADFVGNMADNHGRDVTCLTDTRTYEVELLVAVDHGAVADEAAQQISAAWKFLDKVDGIHQEWRSPDR